MRDKVAEFDEDYKNAGERFLGFFLSFIGYAGPFLLVLWVGTDLGRFFESTIRRNTHDEPAKVAYLCTLEREQRELEQLERGEWPDWTTHTRRTSSTTTLEARRRMADWCLKEVLKAILPALPKYVRVIVQSCLDLREHIWSVEYMNAYFEAQEKASPVCLAASDSL